MGMRTSPRGFALVLAVLLASIAGAQTQPQPRTWRLDFYETGGPGIEAYSFDRLVLEPLPWPDHPAANIDRTQTGNYRFEVVQDNRVVFSRGFDPAFAEWVTTAEAKKVRRTFQESLRFPALTDKADVLLLKRTTEGRYDEVWRHQVDPSDNFIDEGTAVRPQLMELERNGEPRDKVDLLVLGDGYTAAECPRTFRAQARRLTDALFDVDPFQSRRTDFNVWALCPPSARSGVSSPSRDLFRRTPIGASYDAFGSERYILTFENRAWRDIAAWAPYEYVIILTNSQPYGGGGLYNVYSTAAAGNDFATYLFIHEFGHHFAGLADEYYTSPVAYEPPTHITEPWPANVTATTDPARLKWRDQLSRNTPLPTPWPKAEFEAMQKEYQATRVRLREEKRPESEMTRLFRDEMELEMKLFAGAEYKGKVGLFQGANYDARAFYRSEIDCIMFSRNKVPFCRVCRNALSAQIDRHTGE